jgi:hypothetical protein
MKNLAVSKAKSKKQKAKHKGHGGHGGAEMRRDKSGRDNAKLKIKLGNV